MSEPAFQPNFALALENGPDSATRVIVVAGELDSATSEQLVAAAQAELSGAGIDTLVLDLHEVSFIDSTGTHTIVLLEGRAREAGSRLEVISPPEDVSALLRLSGLSERINLVTIDEPEYPAMDFLERIELELAREPETPARARAEVRELLGTSIDELELATVVLLASEVTTNAVLHPRADPAEAIGLRVTAYPERVRVEVDDPGQGFDPSEPVHPTERGGRGLMLVDRGSERWGAGPASTARGARFRVWFEVALGPQSAATAGA